MPSADSRQGSFQRATRDLMRWAGDQLGVMDHERRVAEIASALFTLTRARHGLGPAYRRLLEQAAIVHDVGRVAGQRDHEITGARMILREPSLPLGAAQRRALAYCTRYHRGPVPRAGDDRILTDGDDHRALRITLALLRAADALDSRSLEPPRLTFSAGQDRLRVACLLASDSAHARRVFRRRKKFRLLERLLGYRVVVERCIDERLARAA